MVAVFGLVLIAVIMVNTIIVMVAMLVLISIAEMKIKENLNLH